ncbi:hypothetical protein PR048_011550 [Dryococelus australis]|uniref:Uncharacterized protein n=1 Tax=Dryococelus australis TaxID=614101 RepID=A0ABQ9HN68_9NEOP|nr:hypothetical protein PR048_011550 [Dryococelus australis]
MARRCGLTIEQALRYFQDICEINSGSENSDNDLSSGDTYFRTMIMAQILMSWKFPQDAEVRQQSQTTNTSVTLERNVPTAVQQASQMEVEEDGTEWEVIDVGNNLSGRREAQNVVREKSGPTLHARRQIKDNSTLSEWRLLLTPCILLHIKACTKQEAR